MKIDVDGGRCMTRLGLQLVSGLREELVEKKEVHYSQQPRKRKIKKKKNKKKKQGCGLH